MCEYVPPREWLVDFELSFCRIGRFSANPAPDPFPVASDNHLADDKSPHPKKAKNSKP